MRRMLSASKWAEETIGQIDFGNDLERRDWFAWHLPLRGRLRVRSRVTKVFSDDAERQGAYAFLDHIDADELEAGAGKRSRPSAGARQTFSSWIVAPLVRPTAPAAVALRAMGAMRPEASA